MQQSSDSIDFEVLRGLTNSLVAAKKPDQVFSEASTLCNTSFDCIIQIKHMAYYLNLIDHNMR
jgi:hypothetical protein